MRRFSAILPAILVATLVGGCFPRPDYRGLPSSTVIPRQVTELARVAVADTAAPTAAETAAVADALKRSGEDGVRVKVQLPQGAPVPPTAEMRGRIAALGIDPAVAVVEPNVSSAGTTLVFVRVTLSDPDCAALATPSEYGDADNRPTMAFGCATYSNLGRMLSDPADLESPRNFGGADATTSAAAVDRYHRNKVTPLRQTSATNGLGSSGTSE